MHPWSCRWERWAPGAEPSQLHHLEVDTNPFWSACSQHHRNTGIGDSQLSQVGTRKVNVAHVVSEGARLDLRRPGSGPCSEPLTPLHFRPP